ncbi:hypothetical protein MNBD_BACTEROID03-385 [hydrothermal vent metagenome]|uniref:Outer membrane protein beta-barrel domain-containing protein n=1 Tax=hydrothermal vent metagenome TaxID=652676 RepID=A0A3B0SY38_9ZZZZ
MKKIIIFLLFCSTISSFSQEYTVSGNVQNTEGTPVLYANVLLLKSSDSTIVKGTSTDEKGTFVFKGVLTGNYVVAASYIENISKPMAIEVSSDKNVGTLLINEAGQELDEVVVTYQKPKLERKVDRLVFNVENTSLSDGTIWDLLKHTPSVNEIQGVLTIKGNSNIGVMINGRKINIPESDMIDLLSGTSASSVESIEVITNPPTKYSAEGGMIINIKMKKNLVAGYNGAIFNRYVQGVFAKHTLGTDHYFKGEKTGFSINYSFSDYKGITRYTDIANFSPNSADTSIWIAEQDFLFDSKRHSLNAFFDYEIDENDALSLSTINLYSPNINRVYGTETLIADLNGQLLSSFDTTNDSDGNQLNSSFYFDWVHKLKKKGAEFSMSSHYTYYNSERGQDLETDFFDIDHNITGENDFITQSDQQINLYNIQADYSSPIGKSSHIETGLRFASIASKSTIFQEGFDRDQPGVNPTEVGVFTYDESIYATYLSYNGKWNKWKLKTGLRAEYTKTLGELDTANNPKENDYLELFPSFSMRYTLSEKHDFSLTYYRRISRPRYSNINPFQYFQSNNSVIEGNPDLLPETLNYLGLGYTFKNDYNVDVFYLKHKNRYQRQVFQDNENNLLRFISANINSKVVYGIEFSLNKEFNNFWDAYVLLTYYNTQDGFTDFDSNQLVKNRIWSGTVRVNNGFSFLKDKSLVADLNFAYYLPSVNGNTRQKSYNSLNLSFRKTIWGKRASISMGIDDMFNQRQFFSSRKFLNQNNTSLSRKESRLFTIGFRYKFGNVGIKGRKKTKTVEERKRI